MGFGNSLLSVCKLMSLRRFDSFFFLNENNAGTHSSISNCNFHSRLGDWCPRTDNEWRYKCGSNLNTHDETFEHKIRWLATRYVGVKIKRMFYLMRIV